MTRDDGFNTRPASVLALALGQRKASCTYLESQAVHDCLVACFFGIAALPFNSRFMDPHHLKWAVLTCIPNF